jgi:CreA protein
MPTFHRWCRTVALHGVLLASIALVSPAFAADEPDLIFKRSTVFKWLTPNDKLATYGLDDPEVEGVACHFTVPERGGLKGWIGVAEEVSDISLACRQVGPIRFKQKFAQGEDMFRQRRSLFFKKMQIVRGCDVKRNVLSTWSIPTRSLKVHQRIPPRRCRSCPGGRAARCRSVGIGSKGSDPIPKFASARGRLTGARRVPLE